MDPDRVGAELGSSVVPIPDTSGSPLASTTARCSPASRSRRPARSGRGSSATR